MAAALVAWFAKWLPVELVVSGGNTARGSVRNDTAVIVDRPKAFYQRVGARGLIGLGESYQAGDWDCADLAGLLTTFITRIDELVPPSLRRLRQFGGMRRPADEENTIAGARRNIERHYDLSSEMFRLFLDETMTYSCALFESAHSNHLTADSALLKRAQVRKIDRMLDIARVGHNTRLLEIGTGWGELAIRAAQRGAEVRSITISREQHSHAVQRVAAAGVADRVTVDLLDYREIGAHRRVHGSYDAIVSVEMIEAVGERYWATYFAILDRMLAPGGRIGLQSITTRHDLLHTARRKQSWLNKYIFPGGMLPSVPAIETVISRYTGLQVLEQFEFGSHYTSTLRLWRQNFNDHIQELEKLGFDETFRRTWNLYFAICEAGFRAERISVSQFGLGRRNEK